MVVPALSKVAFLLLANHLISGVYGQESSCDQFDTCGIPCPEGVPPPHKGKLY